MIGVDRYDDPTIPALANAVGDARAIGKVLESQMGYETIVLENATKKAVVTALNGLAVELGPKDSVILYYAGHGELVESTKLGYWQLSDSDSKRPETLAVERRHRAHGRAARGVAGRADLRQLLFGIAGRPTSASARPAAPWTRRRCWRASRWW